MAKKVEVDEYGYIPRYSNMTYGADAKMFNDLQEQQFDFKSYKEAVEAALKYVLENLI